MESTTFESEARLQETYRELAVRHGLRDTPSAL
jgi:hypothetical protein